MILILRGKEITTDINDLISKTQSYITEYAYAKNVKRFKFLILQKLEDIKKEINKLTETV